MNELFTIAKILTSNILDKVQELSCEKVEITYSAFSIILKNPVIEISLNLSLHPLDMPWQITSSIKENGEIIGSIEKIVDDKYNYEVNPRYVITPKFLANVENRAISLSELIVNDIIIALSKIKK